MNRLNYTGFTFGLLTVSGFAYVDQQNKAVWNCVCKCGEKSIVRSRELKKGMRRSCGCLGEDERTKRSLLDPELGMKFPKNRPT